MKLFNYLFVIFCCGLVAGCMNLERSHNERYLKSRTIKPIMVPAGLSSSTINSDYTIPTPSSLKTLKPVDLIPPNVK